MAGLSTILELLTTGNVFAAIAVFLVTYMVTEFVILPKKYPKLPAVGHGSGLLSGLKNIVDYPSGLVKWLGEGYEKYGVRGKSFIIPRILCKPPEIVVPQSQTMWMLNQPDHVLSTVAAHKAFLHTGYNFLDPVFGHHDFHSKVIHKNLARSLNKLIPGMQEEVAYAIDKAFGSDPEEWRYVNVWDAWLTIVPIITNRMLVGPSLNRNHEYLYWMVSFTNCVVRNNFILNLIPNIFKPIVARLLTLDNWWYWRKASALTIPIIKERQHALDRKDAGDAEFSQYELPDDFISWTIKQAREEGNASESDPVMISKRLLPMNFAAIHTTSLTGHSLLLDLLSSDPAKGYVVGIRDEIARAFAEEGQHWTKSGLQKLYRTDSAIRESHRISTFGTTLVERKVIAEQGLTNETEGWHAPKGAYLVLNYNAVHHSKELYPDSDVYDASRFSRPREEAAARGGGDLDESLKMAKMGMVTTSENHISFGHGRHACPGRFFVAHELKMALAYLLLNYDIMPLEERPKPKFVGQMALPPIGTIIKIRRRVEPFTIFGIDGGSEKVN